MATTDDFEVGSKWKTGASVYEVLEVHRGISVGSAWGDYTWQELGLKQGLLDVLKVRGGGGGIYFQPVAFAKTWTKVEPKWEVGKKYRPDPASNWISKFEVTAVDPNGNCLVKYDTGGVGFRLAEQRSQFVETD